MALTSTSHLTLVFILIVSFIAVILNQQSLNVPSPISGVSNVSTKHDALLTLHSLSKRFDINDYNTAVQRGTTYLCMMDATIIGADRYYPSGQSSQSTHLLKDELDTSGWMLMPILPHLAEEVYGENGFITDGLAANGLPTGMDAPWQNDGYYQHAKYRLAPGQPLQWPCMAKYEGSFLLDPPAIIATDIESPRGVLADALRANPNFPIPPLNHWSDVTFLRWYYFTSPGRTPLSTDLTGKGRVPVPLYIIHQTIINQICHDTFEYLWDRDGFGRVMGYANKRRFRRSTTDLAAILACPNSNAVVHFLTEHKRQFGVATIDYVDIWLVDNSFLDAAWNALYKIRVTDTDPEASS